MLQDDYTQEQPILDTLQEALDDVLGGGRLSPGGALRCESAAEVARVVQAAHGYGGAVKLGPAEPERLALDLSGLNHITGLDVTSGLISAEAGCTPAQIEARLNEEGLSLGGPWFAEPDALIGAAIAKGEAWPAVLSLSAVLPDGTAFVTPAAPRRATGPNPDALLVGTCGAVGIIVGVTLRAQRVPQIARAMAFSGTGSKVLEAVRLLFREGLRPWQVTLEKHARGRLRAGFVLSRAEEPERVEAAMAAIGAKAASFEPVAPSRGRPRRLGWRRLAALCAGQGHAGLFVGPVDLHGGWCRLPQDSPPGDATLAALRGHLDPQHTLRLAP